MRAPALPHAEVRFPPDFVRRLERLVLRVSAARERREGAGNAALAGAGDEFVGYRPYRPGEDPRPIDWSLFARLDRPYVRVMRREAAEHWSVHVDTSASMAAGPPGKLQRAAEVACALAAVGLRVGARVQLFATGAESPGPTGGAKPAQMRVRRQADLPSLFAFFEGRAAHGARGLGELFSTRRPPHEAGRVFLLGDLLDAPPQAVAGWMRRGRELALAQLLAPVELDPPESGAVEWWDPEDGTRLAFELDARSSSAYRRRLEATCEAWETFARRHGLRYGCFDTRHSFEDVARRTLAGL